MPTIPSLSLPALDPKPFYAYVGAGDAALETLRSRATVRAEQLKAFPTTIKTLPEQFKAASAQLQEQVKALPLLAAALPTQVKGLPTNVEKRYTELAVRGEKVVASLRGDKPKSTKPSAKAGTKTSAKAKKPATKPTAKAASAATATTPTTPTPPAPAAPTASETPSNKTSSGNGVPTQPITS